MSSGRKSISSYYSKVAPQTILNARDFWSCRTGACRAWRAPTPSSHASKLRQYLSTSELATLRCAALGAGRAACAARTLVLVAEDQPALFEVVGRHFDRHPVARQGLDPVFLHLAGGIGDDLMSRVELNSVAGIGKDFGDQSFELDQLFFSHRILQVDRRLARPLVAVGLALRAAFAVEEGDPLQSFGLAPAVCGAVRLLPIDLVPVGF